MNGKLYEHLSSPVLIRVARSLWPPVMRNATVPMVEVWCSADFLVQVFEPTDGAQRVTVSRVKMGEDGHWVDGITWDELQDVKRQIGRADAWAVEIYPAKTDAVTACNMRHLWLLEEPPPYAWRRT